MSRLLVTNGTQQGRVLRLKPGINRLGRSTENHLQIPDPSVSGSHCEVIFSDARVLVRDLDSTNGTFIDGEQIQEGTIRFGQLLQLGNIEMRLEEPPLPFTGGPGIKVPELKAPEQVASSLLPDGSLACANHSEVAGQYRCTVCRQALCESCVRVIRRVSGGSMVFCSLCAGACEPLAAVEAPQSAKPKSFLGRLTQTLKLPFTRQPGA